MKTRQTLLSLLLVLTLSASAFGQSNDLRIFGYFQNNYSYITTSDIEFFGTKSPGWDTKSFMVQQMNLFAAKNFGTELSSFVNLEFTNSFSSENNVGGFKIEEAWLKYSPSNNFNLKSGLLIPRFNNFNEIKNRTVLLPYIYRPMVYETVFNSQFDIEDFVPLQAYVQIYGDLSLGDDFRFNYAAFMGNSSSENLINNDAGLAAGADSSKSKMFGGRIGFEYDNLAAGVSTTYDKKKATNVLETNLGYVPRIRFGAYLNYSVAGFELEAEYIKVSHKLSAETEAKIDTAGSLMYYPNFAMDKSWIHVNLLYNFTNSLYAYAGYDYMDTEDNWFSMGGLDQFVVGGGYKVNDAIVVKAEYVNQKSSLYGILPVTRQDYLLGASVYF
ncbi:MAG: hypothetical protein R6W90_04230 [Ignavibacteriaceae bacterium]